MGRQGTTSGTGGCCAAGLPAHRLQARCTPTPAVLRGRGQGLRHRAPMATDTHRTSAGTMLPLLSCAWQGRKRTDLSDPRSGHLSLLTPTQLLPTCPLAAAQAVGMAEQGLPGIPEERLCWEQALPFRRTASPQHPKPGSHGAAANCSHFLLPLLLPQLRRRRRGTQGTGGQSLSPGSPRSPLCPRPGLQEPFL